jgi:hypothetical protein
VRALAVPTAVLSGLFVLVAAGQARAGCCRLVKVDSETPAVAVRACESDSSGACGNVLFEGVLALGEEAPLCSATDTIVYQEWDELLAAFAPPVEAVCEGGDVEI